VNFSEGITVTYSLDDIKDLSPVKLNRKSVEKIAKKGGVSHKRGNLGVKNH
jgi:hypothetical protein